MKSLTNFQPRGSMRKVDKANAKAFANASVANGAPRHAQHSMCALAMRFSLRSSVDPVAPPPGGMPALAKVVLRTCRSIRGVLHMKPCEEVRS